MWSLNEKGDSAAAITERGVITYAQLNSAGEKLCSAVGRRCLVFCLCENSPGSMLGYLSFTDNGIVPLMLDSGIDRELFRALISLYKPDFLWMPESMAKETGYDIAYSDMGYSLLDTGYRTEYKLSSELALLLTTSGSTGSPKLVRQTYKNIEANTGSIIEYLKIDNSERAITTLPMSYTYGLSIINSHIAAGAAVILTKRTLLEREFWQTFRDNSATSFGGVPYVYEILDKLKFTRMQLPSLRTMTQAGGKLSVELHEKFAKYAADNDKRFVVMYGQTEATARMGYLPPEYAIEKRGSMGVAIPGGRFTLIDSDGREISEPEVTGELVYEGKNVTMGYAQCGEDLSLGDEWQGKLITGDMAKRDADGFYYIVGRKKRFLKIFGNRVNLDETERMIKGHFGIECACAGADDKMSVFITDPTLCSEVLEFVCAKTGLNRSAFSVHSIDNIPKNEAGKTIYRELPI